MDDVLTGLVEATIVRPGDTLVLRWASELSRADADRIRAQLAEHLPIGVDFLILAQPVEQVLVCRPNDVEAAGDG